MTNFEKRFPILKEYVCLTETCLTEFERIYQTEEDAVRYFKQGNEFCDVCNGNDIGIKVWNNEETIH